MEAGASGVVIIEGEGGSGKTALLSLARIEASARHFQAASGAAAELDSDRPLSPLVEALARLAGSDDADRALINGLLAKGMTGADRSLLGSRELRFRATDAVVGLLERVAQDGPVLLTVDDVQWADPLTVMAIRQAARQLGHVPLGVVVALRPLPRSVELGRVIADIGGLPQAVHMSLEPLGQAAVRELVHRRVGADPGRDLMHLIDRAGGNPFYIDELVAALREGDAIRVEDGRASVARDSTPPSFRATVLRQLDPLSREAHEVVRIAAILGGPFGVSDLALVLGRTPSALAAPVTEAIATGVIGEMGDRLRFRHDVVREAAYEAVPRSLRKALHLQVGRCLAAAGGAPTEVAFHLSAGATTGDGQAIDWLVRAARQVGPFAPTTASDLLRRAIELTERTDPLRDVIATELVMPLGRSGRLGEAIRLAGEVLARTSDPELIGQLQCLLAKGFQVQGRLAESLNALETGLAQPGVSQSMRMVLLADIAGRRFTSGDIDGGRAAAEAVLGQTDAVASPGPMCTALSALALMATMAGRLEEAAEYVRRALDVADRDVSGEAQAWGPRIFLAYYLVVADRVDDLQRAVARGRELDEGGTMARVYAAHSALGLFLAGRWDEALAEADITLADEVWRPMSVLAFAVVAHIALHRGEHPRARRALEAAEKGLDSGGPTRIGRARLMWAKAKMAETDGDPAKALAILEATWANLDSFGIPAEGYDLAPDLVRLALPAGKVSLAADVASGMEELAARCATPSMKGAAERCRGLVDDDASMLAGAAETLRSSSRAWERAGALEDAGMAQARGGSHRDGAAFLEAALDLYERVGARSDEARVNAALRALGVRRGRRGRRARPTHGWGSLTPSELEVIRLTTEGLTSRAIGERLFISPRTVQTHLAHVFSKLGCSNRMELVAVASRHREIVRPEAAEIAD